jgi:hypothetical protein
MSPRIAGPVEALERRLFLSVNILQHGGDPANDGANLAETVLTPGDVNATDFGRQFSTPLDGSVYAQPLYVQNVKITRGSSVGDHSVVYLATMHDSLYAVDANTGAVLWQDSFLDTTNPQGTTATTGVTTVPTTALGSGNLGTQLGIISTPAIELTEGAIFLNANTQEVRSGNTHFVQRLWSVNLSDGSMMVAPAVIGDTISNGSFTSFTGYQYVAGPIVAGSGNNSDPTTYPNTDGWVSAPGGATTPVIAFNALIQMQRTATTLLNGTVYLGYASHGDNGPYYGWVLGFSESTLSLTAAFVTTPTYEGIVGDRTDYTAQGGIWASGSAIATDGTSLYVLTGNGAFNTAPSNFNSDGFPIDRDYADSLLKLSVDPTSSPTSQNGNGWGLGVTDYFTPSNANALNTLDLDLGSGGVLLLPSTLTDAAGNPMLVFGGKESRIYLLDQDNLGKFNTAYPSTGDADPRLYDQVLGEYATDGVNGTTEGVYSTPSYFDGEFYVAADATGTLAFNASSFDSGSIPPGTASAPVPAQTGQTFAFPAPGFSISANGSAGGILWGMDYVHSELVAFDATNISTPLYDSNTVSSDSYTGGVKFDQPTVANGMVYLANSSPTLVGYGVRSAYLSSNAAFFSAPTNLAVSLQSTSDAHLSWISHSSLATEYRIDRSTDDSNWTTLAYVANSVASYDDTTVGAGGYYYRVVAIAGSNTSSSGVVTLGNPTAQLAGTAIGTAGSYQNDGNTIAKAFDGNFATFFDAPSANGNWVGLDLGLTGGVVTEVEYASRSGFTGRMNGGIFQASNSSSFATGVVNLYTIPSNANPSSTALTMQTFSNSTPFRYYRYLSPNGGYGNISELRFLGTAGGLKTLTQWTGTTIGTAGSYQNDGNTIAKATDGNLSTFYDGASANGNWVGLDLGTAESISQINYAPRSGWAGRMVGGMFQISTTANFSSGVTTIYTITATPVVGSFTTIILSSPVMARYVRYLSPTGSYGNIAEMQFFG